MMWAKTQWASRAVGQDSGPVSLWAKTAVQWCSGPRPSGPVVLWAKTQRAIGALVLDPVGQ